MTHGVYRPMENTLFILTPKFLLHIQFTLIFCSIFKVFKDVSYIPISLVYSMTKLYPSLPSYYKIPDLFSHVSSTFPVLLKLEFQRNLFCQNF